LPTRVAVAAQVQAYQRGLAPEPRRRLKQAIIGLANGRGDAKALTDKLAGLHRLRVGEHRVIYRHRGGGIECVYAAPRFTVYEYLATHVRDVLGERR
jgi:mRNA-degrading endonuclease RelE of RelBE toxin-antitoxin system